MSLELPRLADGERLEAWDRLRRPVWLFDPVSCFGVYANRTALALWGASDLEELLSRDFSKLSPAVRTRTERLRVVTADGQQVQENWTFYPNGQPVTVQAVISTVPLSDGREVLLFEAAETDVEAEERRAVEALRHSSGPVGLFEGGGAALFSNPAAFAAYGPDAGFVGRFLVASQGEAVLEAANAGQETKALFQMTTRAGTRWHHLDCRPLLDPVTGALSVLLNERDVTDRVEAEAARAAAEQVLLRQPHVVEEQRRGRDAAGAHLLLLAADAEARAVTLNDEEIDLTRSIGALEPRADQNEVRHRSIGAPDLATVQHEAVAVGSRTGADAGNVGTGLRLGQREGGAQRTRGEAGKQPRLLLRRPAREDGAERHPLHNQQINGIVADPAQLFDREAARERAAQTTIFGREGQGEQAELAQQIEHVLRVFAAGVDGGGARRHAFARDATHQVSDLELLLGQGKGHARFLPVVTGRCAVSRTMFLATSRCAAMRQSNSANSLRTLL